MKRDASSPEDYRRSVTGKQADLLEALRALVLKAVPDVDEGIRYGMLDYPGLANLAAQKHYVSLYVAPAVLEKHARHFEHVDKGKSCLRYRKLDQVEPDRVRALLEAVRTARRKSDASA